MAILVEEEKKPVNILGILMGLTVAAAFFAAIYFFLFKSPQLIDVVIPKNLDDISAISNIDFQPEKVLSSDKLRALRVYDAGVISPQTGRGNPFSRGF